MRKRVAIAAVFAIVGLIWIGQGLGYIPGSFMTGEPTWAYIGAVLLVVAVMFVGSAYRRVKR